MTVEIKYLIDNENWTDEQFENQEEKVLKLNSSDLSDMLRYGRVPKYTQLESNESIHEITDVTTTYGN